MTKHEIKYLAILVLPISILIACYYIFKTPEKQDMPQHMCNEGEITYWETYYLMPEYSYVSPSVEVIKICKNNKFVYDEKETIKYLIEKQRLIKENEQLCGIGKAREYGCIDDYKALEIK